MKSLFTLQSGNKTLSKYRYLENLSAKGERFTFSVIISTCLNCLTRCCLRQTKSWVIDSPSQLSETEETESDDWAFVFLFFPFLSNSGLQPVNIVSKLCIIFPFILCVSNGQFSSFTFFSFSVTFSSRSCSGEGPYYHNSKVMLGAMKHENRFSLVNNRGEKLQSPSPFSCWAAHPYSNNWHPITSLSFHE